MLERMADYIVKSDIAALVDEITRPRDKQYWEGQEENEQGVGGGLDKSKGTRASTEGQTAKDPEAGKATKQDSGPASLDFRVTSTTH